MHKHWQISECTGLYQWIYRNVYTTKVGYMWCSSNRFCELPYNVTGIVKYTGSEETSKDICKDRKIGTR